MQKGVALAPFARSARRTLSWLQAALFSAACSCRLRPRGSGASLLAFSIARVQLEKSNKLSMGDESSIAAANYFSETNPMAAKPVCRPTSSMGKNPLFMSQRPHRQGLSFYSNSHIGHA